MSRGREGVTKEAREKKGEGMEEELGVYIRISFCPYSVPR